jgi:hypothetical protein
MNWSTKTHHYLHQLRFHIIKSHDGIYGCRSTSLDDINHLLALPSLKKMKRLLLPTGNLNELAIDNGWENEFNHLANLLEKLFLHIEDD